MGHQGISHGKFWTNLEVTGILRHVLNNRESDKPAFFMLWYDCREDANTSHAVEEAVSAFKKHDLFDDSIVILTSDHGYPDPRTGLNKNTMRNLRHDLVVTDDNIKIPLFIKVPNVAPGRRNAPVSTIDFTPTIMDFLDLREVAALRPRQVFILLALERIYLFGKASLFFLECLVLSLDLVALFLLFEEPLRQDL